MLNELLASTFRANPGYALAPLESLSAAERSALELQRNDPEFFGILRPRDASGLGIKLIDSATALLFLALESPGPLPAAVRARLGEHANTEIASLVLDGVLELETGRGFVSGAESFSAVFRHPRAEERVTRPMDLSQAAIRYAEHLEVETASELSLRLYLYNRVPATPAWRARIPDAAAARAFLGLGSGSAVDRDLERHWTTSEGSTSPSADPWLSFHSRHRSRAGGTSGYAFKLYVSPQPEALPEAFARTLAVLSEIRAPVFKVGHTLEDLLRPDKLVAYFWSRDELRAAIERLVPALHGIPAQGVPFTSSAADGGLVAWGVDPPSQVFKLTWEEPESWRFWVTNRLATALLAARKRPGLDVSAAEFALRRLRLSGVDTESWAPAEIGGYGRDV